MPLLYLKSFIGCKNIKNDILQILAQYNILPGQPFSKQIHRYLPSRYFYRVPSTYLILLSIDFIILQSIGSRRETRRNPQIPLVFRHRIDLNKKRIHRNVFKNMCVYVYIHVYNIIKKMSYIFYLIGRIFNINIEKKKK